MAINSQDIDDNVTIQDPISGYQAEIDSNKRLKVDATISNFDDSSSCQFQSAKFRAINDHDNYTVSSSFSTMYSYSGSGKFFGLVQCYDDDDTEVKLTIDSEVIFSINLEDLDNFELDGNNTMCGGWLKLIQSSGDNRFEFCPPCPIAYETSVLIEARRTDSTNNQLQRQLIFISKES